MAKNGRHDPDTLNKRLIHSVGIEDWDEIENIVRLGADVNCRDDTGDTPLMEAFNCSFPSGRLAMVKYLVGLEADVNAANKRGETVLMKAVSNPGRVDLSAIEFLIENGAHVNAQSQDRRTAASAAANAGNAPALKLLLDSGADVEAPDNSGFNPLLKSVLFGHHDVAEVCLDHQANIEVRDRSGRTALMLAALGGHVEVVRVLIDRGADLNAQNGVGLTALMYAADRGYNEIGRLLLEGGADPRITDRMLRHTAYDHGEFFPDFQRMIAEYLVLWGPTVSAS